MKVFGLSRNLVRLALVIVAVAFGLMFMGYLIGHCQTGPNCYIMNQENLRAIETILESMGHTIKAFDGVALGTEEQRQAGTGLAVIRARTLEGKWLNFIVLSEKGLILKVRTYPIPPPAAWKGD